MLKSMMIYILVCDLLFAFIVVIKINVEPSGQVLVNDPMMTDSTGVKAHIKLRFQNQANQTCVAVRSLQVMKKKNKLEFKALEGVLRTTNKDGESVSISMKCADIDRVIPENLGISPAIIENVIFVHQEDCK
jgi:DNA repair exonuclease SbcCD ATPase subunit